MLLDGKSIHPTPSKEVAKVLGLLPQSPVAPEGITVADLVGRGRYPHQGWFRQWSAADDEAVADALTATDTIELADRPIEDMSGGQRQRVWIAMALAQETDLLLLDEPTTYLDLTHQVEVLDLLTDLNRQRGHDHRDRDARPQPGLPLRRPPRSPWPTGRIGGQGSPAEVITPETMQEVFGMDSVIINDPVSQHADGHPDRAPPLRRARRTDLLKPFYCGASTRLP